MAKYHEEKIEIMRKYLGKIANGFSYHIKGDIPSKKIDNAIKTFASGIERTSIIGFFDTTVFRNGKNGYIFTDDKIYYLDTLEKPKKLWYDDIKSMRIINTQKKDCDRALEITQYDGVEISIASSFINKTPLKEFLEIMKDFLMKKTLVQNVALLFQNLNLDFFLLTHHLDAVHHVMV